MARRLIHIQFGHAGHLAHSLALLGGEFGWTRASLKLVGAALKGKKIGDEPVPLRLTDHDGHTMDCLVSYVEE
jgi:purine-cytosine permease-like protein